MRLRIVISSLLLSPLVCGQFADRAHPRLWMNEAREKEMRQVIAGDPLAAKLHQEILKEADAILERRPCAHLIHDGRRLLRESRLAIHQITHCAWAWRFTGDQKYLERTIRELESACGMKDWNPSHFLDVAEMAMAVGVGYDWLHDDLSPEQREMCESAIRDKALKPARHLYDTDVWWSDGRNNWAQVCGGGIAVAAIAIQGRDEKLSEGLIRDGLALVKKCERFYSPDGIYPEGPGYWHYGTIYHTALLAACEALDHPVSIPDLLEKSGDCMIHLHGPTRLPFNFSDGHAKPSGKSQAQAWIASRFNNPQQSRSVREVLAMTLDPEHKELNQRSSPFTLLWLPRAVADCQPMPLHAVFHGEQATAVFRSSWKADASWLAIKGGTPHGGHGHMDVGSFCYDAHGTRWIHDMGGDNYNMPGYFKDQRFSYYRLQNRSHNTLEINGGLQVDDCKPCPITASDVRKNPHATFNLTGAYAGQAQQVTRTATFDPQSGTAVIRDEIIKPKGEVVWRIITDARCEVREDKVVLLKGKETVELERLSKTGAWSVSPASPPQEIENDNEGYSSVSLTVPAADAITIEVAIRP